MAAGDALSGAASGAASGSAFGPWGAAIGGAIGLASSFLGSKRNTTPIAPDVFNAYGEKNVPAKGAIQSRDNIFGTVNSPDFQANSQGFADQYRRALQGAAVDPRLSAVSNYGSDVLNGRYLSSPVVNQYADQASNSILSGAADQDLRTRAMYNNAGMGFSTGLAQAQQAAHAAAATHAAATKAGILSSNYQNERGLQAGGADILSGAVSQPLNYLGAVNNAMYAPLQSQADLTTQLLGSNQVREPTLVQDPSFADKLAGGAQTAAGLYSLLRNVKTG